MLLPHLGGERAPGLWAGEPSLQICSVTIPGLSANVSDTTLATTISVGDVRISTVEHLMAAVAGCGIHNLLIEIDGPEVPILDGSSLPFVRGIMQRGLRQLAAPVMAFDSAENRYRAGWRRGCDDLARRYAAHRL